MRVCECDSRAHIAWNRSSFAKELKGKRSGGQPCLHKKCLEGGVADSSIKEQSLSDWAALLVISLPPHTEGYVKGERHSANRRWGVGVARSKTDAPTAHARQYKRLSFGCFSHASEAGEAISSTERIKKNQLA